MRSLAKDQLAVSVFLYYLPHWPGQRSCRCAPSGQCREDIDAYVTQLEAILPEVKVEPIVVPQEIEFDRDRVAMRLINELGGAACPILAVKGQAISAGSLSIAESAAKVKTILSGTHRTIVEQESASRKQD